MAADYSKSELERMQREAVRRVKDMQEKARNPGRNAHSGGRDASAYAAMPSMPHFLRPPERDEHSTPPSEPEHRRDGAAHTDRNLPAKKTKGFDLLNMLNLKSLQMDADRSIVLMLLTLLSGEETDELLLLALMYIML